MRRFNPTGYPAFTRRRSQASSMKDREKYNPSKYPSATNENRNDHGPGASRHSHHGRNCTSTREKCRSTHVPHVRSYSTHWWYAAGSEPPTAYHNQRNGSGARERRERIRAVGRVPRQVQLGPAEVAVRGGLPVDGPQQVGVTDDRGGPQVE